MRGSVILLLILLSLICVLMPLQRATAEVTLSVVGDTSQETTLTDTDDITFTVHVTSEAGDSHDDINVSCTGIGVVYTDRVDDNGYPVLKNIIYPIETSLSTLTINGAGTQDVSITLKRSEISRVHRITISFTLFDFTGFYRKLDFYVNVLNNIDMSLEVKEGVIQDLPVEERILQSEDEMSDVTFTLKITNNETSNLKVDLTLPVGLVAIDGISFNINIDPTQVRLSSTSVTLAPGASEEVTLTVPGSLFLIRSSITIISDRETIQNWHINYKSYYFKVVATPEGGAAESVGFRINVIRPVIVAKFFLKGLEGLTQTTTTDDADDITYTLRATNAGNNIDRIHFKISGDIGTATVNQSEIVLFPDAYEDITLTIPRTALLNVGTYNVTVTATSGNNPLVSAGAFATTTVTDDTPTDPTITTNVTDVTTVPDGTPLLTQPDQSTHQVVLSEFMYETGGVEAELPQWIEVYNNSNTEVNLRGWKLHWNWKRVRSSPKRVRSSPLETTVTFDADFRIPPQHAGLIVTALGRRSGGGNLSNDAVYQLAPLLVDAGREGIRINIIVNDIIRSFASASFSLKLLNSEDILIDQIGTLSDDEQTWELPESLINGVRSSLIRRFDESVPRSGMERLGWIRAVDVKRLVAGIYYGNPFDLGTPGYRRGKPLPVELSQFSAKLVKGEVVINWTTESELDNAGSTYTAASLQQRTSNASIPS